MFTIVAHTENANNINHLKLTNQEAYVNMDDNYSSWVIICPTLIGQSQINHLVDKNDTFILTPKLRWSEQNKVDFSRDFSSQIAQKVQEESNITN